MLAPAVPTAALAAKWPSGNGPKIPQVETARASSTAAAPIAYPTRVSQVAAPNRSRQLLRTAAILENLGAFIVEAQVHLDQALAPHRRPQTDFLLGVKQQKA